MRQVRAELPGPDSKGEKQQADGGRGSGPGGEGEGLGVGVEGLGVGGEGPGGRSRGRGYDPDSRLICPDEWVVFNVGGAQFLTRRSTLLSVPNTVLADLDEESKHYHPATGQYLFDRNPLIFQVGHLHRNSACQVCIISLHYTLGP